jgi:hypothetical protein
VQYRIRLPNAGSATFTLGFFLPASSGYRIRVVQLGNGFVKAFPVFGRQVI